MRTSSRSHDQTQYPARHIGEDVHLLQMQSTLPRAVHHLWSDTGVCCSLSFRNCHILHIYTRQTAHKQASVPGGPLAGICVSVLDSCWMLTNLSVEDRYVPAIFRRCRRPETVGEGVASFGLPGCQEIASRQASFLKLGERTGTMNPVISLQNPVSLGGSLKRGGLHRRQASIPSSPKVVSALTGLHTRHASIVDAPVDITFRWADHPETVKAHQGLFD